MAPANPQTAARGAFASRRREVERGLAGLAFPRLAADPWTEARALRSALESLGPVFSSFGLYLATRPDLLPLGDCLELSGLEPPREPTPPLFVRERIACELGQSPEEIFAELEESPFRCGLIRQWHRARLRDGRPVTVKLVHPDLEARLGFDLELLPLLGKPLAAGRSVPKAAFEAAVSDFAAGLRRQADFLAELQALVVLRDAGAGPAPVRVPAVVAPLSRPKLLCLENLPGEGAVSGGARRLWLAWLHLALVGPAFPFELDPAEVRLLPDGSVGLLGGAFAALPPEARTDLLAYLLAAGGDDPGDAAAPLLRNLEPLPPEAGQDVETELRRQFRQVVPMRDAGWGSHGRPDLAEHLFVHWRLASGHGLRPLPHLVAFYRGLFAVWISARRFEAADDPLAAALGDLRLLSMVEQLRELLDFGRLPRRLEGYAAAALSLPRQIDEALDLAAGNGRPLVVRVERDAERDRRPVSLALVAALLLALAGVALLSRRFLAEAALEPWGEIVTTTFFLVLGGLLLRAIGRPG